MQPRSICALPSRSPELEAESQRIAAATEAFLARGGEIEQVGAKMLDGPAPFFINPRRTPVYAHLFEQSKALSAFPAPLEAAPAVAAQPVAQVPEQVLAQIPAAVSEAPLSDAQLAGRVMAKAVLGNPPKRIGEQLNLSEKKVRQLCRDYNITVRQR
uniref:Transcriptional regulator SutA RNAP-binding domain-containing protein n=1 Tax=viral metagenome TaxID=1070528 RepID=A0A6H1ZD25_9ZZZZ